MAHKKLSTARAIVLARCEAEKRILPDADHIYPREALSECEETLRGMRNLIEDAISEELVKP